MLLNCCVGEDSWTARRCNQSILKEISPEYLLEGLMLKLKLQHFGHLMQRTNSLEKTLMLGKIEGWRTRCQQRMKWLDGITDTMDMSWVGSGSWWWIGKPGVLQSMGSQRVGHDWATELKWGGVLVVKNLPPTAGDVRDQGLIARSGRSLEKEMALQYSCLENTMDEGAWWATVHRVAKSRTWLKWLGMHLVHVHIDT